MITSVAVSAVLAVGSLVVAFLHKRGKDKAANDLQAVLDILKQVSPFIPQGALADRAQSALERYDG